MKYNDEFFDYTQKQINDVAEIVKELPQSHFGGSSALFFYDEYDNFIFCFRTKLKTRNEILNSFAKFYQYCINNDNVMFDLKLMLEQARKIEFIFSEV